MARNNPICGLHRAEFSTQPSTSPTRLQRQSALKCKCLSRSQGNGWKKYPDRRGTS